MELVTRLHLDRDHIMLRKRASARLTRKSKASSASQIAPPILAHGIAVTLIDCDLGRLTQSLALRRRNFRSGLIGVVAQHGCQRANHDRRQFGEKIALGDELHDFIARGIAGGDGPGLTSEQLNLWR